VRRRRAAAETAGLGGDGEAADFDADGEDFAAAEDAGDLEDVNLSDEADSVAEPDAEAGDAGGLDESQIETVVEEADFHIAYGTFDKAVKQLEEALEQHPGEGQLHLKLLETHFAASDAEAFVSAAERMRSKLGSDSSEWSEAARLGREIAPNNALFAGVAAPEPAVEQEEEADLTPPEAQTLEVERRPAEDTEEIQIDLGDSEDLDAGTDQAEEEEIGFDLPDMDADAESTDAGDVAAPTEESSGDEELSFDLPDLDDDGGQPSAETPSQDDAPAPADEDFSLDEEAARVLDRSLEEEDSGKDEGEDLDFPTVDVPPEKASEAFGTDSQAQFEKAFEELSSYMGSEEEGKASSAEAPGSTTDDDVAGGGIDFGDDDDDLLDLGDDDSDEMGEIDTKIDLARAYIDMGDSEGAQGILEEVLEEGNEDQKKEAQSLLDGI